MTNISQVDQAILLLQERLRRLRSGETSGAARNVRVQSRTPRPAAQLRNVLAVEGVPPRQLRRALVRSLLADAFGEAVANDLSFQGIADQVTDILEADPDTAALLDRAVEQIRKQP
jgi:hypothetical protein